MSDIRKGISSFVLMMVLWVDEYKVSGGSSCIGSTSSQAEIICGVGSSQERDI